MTDKRDWLMQALRENLESRDTSDEAPFVRDFTRRLMSAIDEPEPVQKSNVTLKQDALDVLGDVRDEVLDDIIARLDAMVTRARSGGAVILSASESDSVWDAILKSQLREKIRKKLAQSGTDSDWQMLANKSPQRCTQDTDAYRDAFG